MIILAVLGLLAVLAARVDAAPDDGEMPIDVVEAAPEPEPAAPLPVVVPVPEAALARARASAPPVSAVVAAAYRSAGLDRDPGPSWRARTRLAGMVPMVSVRDGEDATWRDIVDPTITRVHIFAVNATWRLDRLVFDPNELRISAIEFSRRRERRHLAELVIHLYYAWLHAQAADGPLGARAEEVGAELDAITDGWFSEHVTNPAESR